jgi:hypothetical protein
VFWLFRLSDLAAGTGDLDFICSRGKFVVSTSVEAYDARESLNREFQLNVFILKEQ